MSAEGMGKEIRHFGYEIGEALYYEAVDTLGRIHAGGRADQLGREAAGLLVRLTEVGFEAYYEKPADMITLSPMIRKAADTGMSAIFKAVDMVIHRVLAKRSLAELQQMATDMSQMICASQDEMPRFLIAFPLPNELYERSQTLITRVQQDPEVDAYRDDIIDSLEQLIEEAIQVFYSAPIGKVEVGRITRAAADMGISTVKKGSSMVLNKVFRSMPHDKLIPLADYFQTLLHQDASPYSPPPH